MKLCKKKKNIFNIILLHEMGKKQILIEINSIFAPFKIKIFNISFNK